MQGLNTLTAVGVATDGRVQRLLSVGGLDVAIMLDPPCTADLLRHYVDLVVVSDYVGFSAFARLVDSSSPYTAGFLTSETLDNVRARFGHHARNPRGLLELPAGERSQPRNVDRHCTLLHLGVLDRTYAGKFLFFVPSLVYDDHRVPDLYAEEYIECAMYVAAARRSRAVFFAGFGGTDGSFSDTSVVTLVDRIHDARSATLLPPVRVFFKYFPLVQPQHINRLISRLSQRLRASANGDANP